MCSSDLGRWTLERSTLFGESLGSAGSAVVTGEGERLRVAQGDATVVLGSLRAEARGTFGAPGDRLAWTVQAPRLDQLPAMPWTSELARGLAGAVQAQGTLEGSWSRWQVNATARGSELRGADNVSARTVNLRASAGNLPQSPFDVTIEGEQWRATGMALARARITAQGTLAQHDIRLGANNDLLDLDARLQGRWQDAGWEGAIVSLANRGSYPLALRAPAALELSPTHVHLGRLEASFGEGRLLVREAQWTRGAMPGMGRISSSGEFTDIPSAWLAAPAGLESVRTTLRLGGDWSLESTPQLNGRFTLRRTGGDVYLEAAGVELGLSKAIIDGRFTQGSLGAEATVDARVGTLRGSIRTSPEPGIEEGLGFTPRSPLALEANIELAEMRPLLAAFQTQGRVAGRAVARLRGSGTLGKPQLEGTLEATGLGYELPPWGLSVHDGRLRARLLGDNMEITELFLRSEEHTSELQSH